jgi:hypothetical protein
MKFRLKSFKNVGFVLQSVIFRMTKVLIEYFLSLWEFSGLSR